MWQRSHLALIIYDTSEKGKGGIFPGKTSCQAAHSVWAESDLPRALTETESSLLCCCVRTLFYSGCKGKRQNVLGYSFTLFCGGWMHPCSLHVWIPVKRTMQGELTFYRCSVPETVKSTSPGERPTLPGLSRTFPLSACKSHILTMPRSWQTRTPLRRTVLNIRWSFFFWKLLL